MTTDRLVAVTRQVTGLGYVHHAYVHNRATGRYVRWCAHRHRHTATAQRCADRMLRAVRQS